MEEGNMTVEEVLVTLSNVKDWGGQDLPVQVAGTGEEIQSMTLKIESDGLISRVTINTEDV
jgi:hypothetical protein